MLFKKRYWHLNKHEGDSAIYASCVCGFEYNCSDIKLPEAKIVLKKLYKYCPNCGKKYKTDKYIADRIYFK